MRPVRTRRRLRVWASLGIAYTLLVSGCHLMSCGTDDCHGKHGHHRLHRDPHADIPQGALPEPNGTFVKDLFKKQGSKAEADDFVIYQYEWFEGGDSLGPYGGRHFAQMVRRLQNEAFGVLIEADTDPKMNEARKLRIINMLTEAGIRDAEIRVSIGYPRAEGLYGDEAEDAYNLLLAGGGQGAGAGSAFGAFNPIFPGGIR